MWGEVDQRRDGRDEGRGSERGVLVQALRQRQRHHLPGNHLDIILFHFKTSQGLVLKMKPVDSGKNALAAVAALMPCSACNKGVLQSGPSTVDVKYLLLP